MKVFTRKNYHKACYLLGHKPDPHASAKEMALTIRKAFDDPTPTKRRASFLLRSCSQALAFKQRLVEKGKGNHRWIHPATNYLISIVSPT